MKNVSVFTTFLLFCAALLFSGRAVAENVTPQLAYEVLKEAYGPLVGEMSCSGGICTTLVNGRKIFLNGQTVENTIVSHDVVHTLEDPYPLEPNRPVFPYGVCPGRTRNHSLLEALYGSTKAEVTSQLERVRFMGRDVLFSSTGGAAEALRRVASEIESAVAAKPELNKYFPTAGGFLWRRIRGEKILSPHSYGIAIDLNPKYATYWKWEKPDMFPHPQQASYPAEIVNAFERNGFIWGGKWHNYDIMHFEYRPEIIILSNKRK